MNPTKTLPFNDDLASRSSEKVATLFSDRSVNFILEQGQSELTLPQEKYLSERLGFPISKIVNIRQAHGDQVIAATAAFLNLKTVAEADGIVTNVVGLPI